MKDNLKENFLDILKQGRIWVLLTFILIALVTVNYTFNNSGVVINGLVPGSLAEKVGFEFKSTSNLRSLEKIESLNGKKISSEKDFYNFFKDFNDSQLKIITDRKSDGYIIKTNSTINKSYLKQIGISIRSAPSSNIKLGIELEGGSRLILKPVKDNLSDIDYNILINALQSRLDIYGASGTKVNKLEDAFSNQKFVIVESTSSNKNDIFELIKRQGKFLAKIGNETIFTGDNVIRVFSDPKNARLQGCSDNGDGFVCSYGFLIEIDSDGGDAFFAKTSKLNIVSGGYLSEKVAFFLDGEEITALNIASSFKFNKITNPQITVSGNPMPTREKALASAQKEMKFLQAILSTQSLPSKLDVAQSYSISSSLGDKFLANAIWVGIAALFIVASIVAIRYNHIAIFIGILITLIAEVILVFGAAAFLRLSIDLAAIGGLIAAIGTGVDDQIIITDEYFRKRKNTTSRKRIKTALYIIMIAYLTTLAAMIPLYFAGLKILQGFAFMIIIGVTVGVFITRPAYAAYLRIIMTNRKQRKDEEEEDRN